MAPKHRFTTAADGTPIAYRVQGDGRALVFTNGYATSDFYWRSLTQRFADKAKLVTWDLKGHGRSAGANDMGSVGIEHSADDLRRVMDAAGVERATLVGFSLGCQVTFEAWRQFPDRIDAIIPVLGTYQRPFDNLLHPKVGPHLHRVFKKVGPPGAPAIVAAAYLVLRSPLAHRFNQTFGLIGREVGRDSMQPFYDHFALIEPKTWVAMGLAAQGNSAADILHTVDVPTLIVAGGRDALTPLDLSYDMHERIDGSEIMLLPRATHAGLFEYPEEIGNAIESFLTRYSLL